MMAGHARPSYFSTSPVFCIPWKRGKMGKTNKHTKLQTGNRSHFHGIWCFESILVFSIFGCRKKPAKKHMLYKFIYIYIDDIFGPIIIQLMLRRTGARFAPHRCMIVYRSIRGHFFFWSPILFVWLPTHMNVWKPWQDFLIDDIFGPIIIQLVLRRTGAWLRRTGAWYFIEVDKGVVFFDPPPCLFDLPCVILIPHERNRKWNSKKTQDTHMNVWKPWQDFPVRKAQNTWN